MSEKDQRAHDLALVFVQNLHPDLKTQSDESTLEFLWQSVLTDYEDAYEYFRLHIGEKG